MPSVSVMIRGTGGSLNMRGFAQRKDNKTVYFVDGNRVIVCPDPIAIDGEFDPQYRYAIIAADTLADAAQWQEAHFPGGTP